MKSVVLPFILLLMLGVNACAQESIHQFTVKDIDGKDFPLSQLKGKKVMVVNTASKCGLTPQYEQLEQVYKKFGGDDFVIVGFPANDFMSQEPGSNDEIASFCQKNYGVTFPMMSKISVKGKGMNEVYKFLTTKALNGLEDNEVKWNFQKFMIDENGNLVGMAKSGDDPFSEEIIKFIGN